MAKTGRPTSYRKEHCETVVRLGKLGKSKAQMAAAIGVSRLTLDNWAQLHPEFLSAIAHARELAQAWWETQGQKGIWHTKDGKQINAQLWSRSMAARFPDEYREKIEHSVQIDLADRLLAARKRTGK